MADTRPGGGSGAGAQAPAGEEHKLVAERRAKLAQLRRGGGGGGGSGDDGGGDGAVGAIAFPNDFRRDALAGQLHASFGERSAEWLDANPTRVKGGGGLLFPPRVGEGGL